LWSSLHETWCGYQSRSYDGTHGVLSAIGRAKPRFPALKILTEVHVPHESAPGPPRSRGQPQRTRYTADQSRSDVAVDRRSSLLLPCFSWLFVCSTWICERRNIVRGTTPCVRGSSDGTRLGSTTDSRKVGFFIQAVMSLYLANVRSFSDYSIFTSSILVISMLKETPASRRFVWCTSCHVTTRQSLAGIICCTAQSQVSRALF
jgi:hypothetical protein